MVRVSDYVIEFLESKNVKHVFTVTGGGAMFLNDGVAKSKKITPVFCHHEQACTMAAVSYSKVNNELAVVMPTTGCGGTNTITGLLDAWQDSHKLLIIAGQVNKHECTYFSGLKLRKLGAQEANLVDIVKSITKFAECVDSPQKIRYYLEKAFYECSSNRPGPVWLEIPLDIQGSYINPEELESFDEPKKIVKTSNIESILRESKRPVVIAGNGINLANARNEFKAFVEKYNLPVVCTYLGADLFPEDHRNYIGRTGVKGTRAGNFAVQNSDLVLSIGSSLSIPVTGYKYDTFAREAKIVAVDIDPIEHQKSTIKVDTVIESDILDFINCNMNMDFKCNEDWMATCNRWKYKWPTHKSENKKLNLYTFSKTLSDSIKDLKSITICDAGLSYYAMGQSIIIGNKNRYITSGAQAEMGFTIPACIGAHFADPSFKIFGVTGDGSFQFNIQELQTIVHYKLPIKIFVVNNGGYLSIKNTQDKFFSGRYFGINPEFGVSFPSLKKIANAYGFKYTKIDSLKKLKNSMQDIVMETTPIICELMMPKDEQILPTSSTKQLETGKIVSQPLENMFPFLSEEEFNSEMIVKPL
jgi:acetolactate synthase-1/2/3 large subunit